MAQQVTKTDLIKTAPRANSLRLTGDADSLLDVIRAWHDDEHPDAWPVCMQQPCHAAQDFVAEVQSTHVMYR